MSNTGKDIGFKGCLGLILLGIVVLAGLALLGEVLEAVMSFFDSIGFFGFWGLVIIGFVGFALLASSQNKNEGP